LVLSKAAKDLASGPRALLRTRWRMLCGGILSAAAVAVLGPSIGTSSRALAQSQTASIEEPAGEAGQTRMRLITEAQYRNTIANIFGADIKVDTRFPPTRRLSGLMAVGAASAGVSASDVESFHARAYAIADQVVSPERRADLVRCQPADPKAADAVCAGRFLKAAGRLLYRRPLTEAELKAVVGKAGEAAGRFNSFYSGVSFALAGMLTSPQFLFVAEQSEPDPGHPGQLRLTGLSLATRISLLLWNAYPDDELLRSAESGRLHDPAERARQADAMIASPRFEQGVRAFFGDMFAFESFNNLAKDGMIYPAFTNNSVTDAAEQTLKLLVDHVVDKDADYRDVFTTRTTFLTPSLAPLYNVPAPSSEWAKYRGVLERDRSGLLTQVGFLATQAHTGRSSPTRRGRAIRELVLCQHVPDPPPNVDFSIVEDPHAKFKNARERLRAHNTDPVCAGCHKITDPIGLALENFDGAGQHRTLENGAPIDASGELDGVGFKDAAGLGEAVRNNPGMPECLVQRVFAYAVGRATTDRDSDLLGYFNGRFQADGYRVKALMRTVAVSRALERVSAAQVTAAASASAVKTQ